MTEMQPGPDQGPAQAGESQQPPSPQHWQAPPAQQGGGQASTPSAGGGWQQVPPPSSWTPPAGGPGTWAPPPIESGPAAGITYAGFVVRLVAYIIDGIILLIPNWILSAIFVTSSVQITGSSLSNLNVSVNYGGLALVTILQLAISAAYFVYTWTAMRATPGDRILGLMVLNQADGSALTMNQAAIRWLILAGPGALSALVTAGTFGLGAIVGLLVFLWYLYLAWTTATDPRRQGFHDKYVNSVVVKATLS